MPRFHQERPIGFHCGHPLVHRRRSQPLYRLHVTDPILQIPSCHLIGIKGLVSSFFVPFGKDFYNALVSFLCPLSFSMFLQPFHK